MLLFIGRLPSVVQDIAIGAGSRGFDFGPIKSDTMSPISGVLNSIVREGFSRRCFVTSVLLPFLLLGVMLFLTRDTAKFDGHVLLHEQVKRNTAFTRAASEVD